MKAQIPSFPWRKPGCSFQKGLVAEPNWGLGWKGSFRSPPLTYTHARTLLFWSLQARAGNSALQPAAWLWDGVGEAGKPEPGARSQLPLPLSLRPCPWGARRLGGRSLDLAPARHSPGPGSGARSVLCCCHAAPRPRRGPQCQAVGIQLQPLTTVTPPPHTPFKNTSFEGANEAACHQKLFIAVLGRNVARNT